MDALEINSTLNRNNIDTNVLNNATQIIIKKENIGLHEHQHQNYQYSLFNNNEKRDQFYEDLAKIKERLDKSSPSMMKRVVHMDMKRAEINKIYERKLLRELTGSHGLNWQYKHELQRLENGEREIERDLKRLNHDRIRASRSCLSQPKTSIRQSISLPRSKTPCFSIVLDSDSMTDVTLPSTTLQRQSSSIYIHRTTIDRLPMINSKRISNNKTPLKLKENCPTLNSIPPHLRKHVNSINRQQQEIEQKLKEFFH